MKPTETSTEDIGTSSEDMAWDVARMLLWQVGHRHVSECQVLADAVIEAVYLLVPRKHASVLGTVWQLSAALPVESVADPRLMVLLAGLPYAPLATWDVSTDPELFLSKVNKP